MEVEVAFVEQYVGQPMFGEVDQFIRSHGFYLLDLELSHTIRPVGSNPGACKGQLFDANALYICEIDHLDEILNKYRGRPNEDDQIRAKLLKAMSICCLYPHMDYALDILEKYADHFTEVERKDVVNSILRSVPLWRRVLREGGLSVTLYHLYRSSPLFKFLIRKPLRIH